MEFNEITATELFVLDEYMTENICEVVPTHILSVPGSQDVVIAEIFVPTRSSDSQDFAIIDELSEDQQNAETITQADGNKKVRKRERQMKSWKSTIRKTKFQAGQEHINTRGNLASKKEIKNKKNCEVSCKFKCSAHISTSERELIFKNYYELNRDGKHNFIAKTTVRNKKKRATTAKDDSRRVFSFTYYFEVGSDRVQVCKTFFLGTLCISQKPVYNVHAKKNTLTGTPRPSTGTRDNITRKISQEDTEYVMLHIQSFPCVESHYARARTARKYLDANLNVAKMYDLYKEKCESDKKPPVTQSFYRKIFMTKFNLDFHVPKTDRCGKCELEKDKPENEKSDDFKAHTKLKLEMRDAKAVDKESTIPIICFDLQNVITCPRTGIGEAFYLSKLNVYNLTAHLSTTKTVYCAVWTEYTSGRSGNDLASAVYKILSRIFDDHNFKNIITWSDSCVPQNKNSYMTYAIQLFLKRNPDIETITMKYSLAGHSALQEVDHAHSEIEKVLRKNEFFSPIGLLRVMKNINRKRPYKLIQLQPNDFKDFAECAKVFDYKGIPYSKLKMLKFSSPLHIISYSLNYNENDFVEVNVRPTIRSKRNQSENTYELKEPRISSKTSSIPDLKKKHLQKMFQYMGEVDISYYNTILKIGWFLNIHFPQYK